MKLRHSLATAIVLTAGVVAGDAAAHPPPTVIDVVADYEEPAPDVDGAWCRGLSDPARLGCGGTVTGVAYFTGVLHGTQHYELDGGVLPDGKLWYEGIAHFTGGGVAGCGTGDFDVEETDGWVDMARFDPVTMSAPGFNRWVILAHTATGQLAGRVAGSGVNNWTAYFDKAGTPRDFGRGRFTGTVTCER